MGSTPKDKSQPPDAPPRKDRRRRYDPDWEPPIPGKRRILASWDDYMALAKQIVARAMKVLSSEYDSKGVIKALLDVKY